MRPRVLIVGDSHVAVFGQPLRRLARQDARPHAPDVSLGFLGGGHLLRKPFSRCVPGGVQLFVETPKEYLTFIKSDDSLAAVGVCANFNTGAILRRGEWDRFAPAAVARDEYPLSTELFLELLRTDQQHLFAFIDDLRQSGIRVFAIEAPGPFHHHLAMTHARIEVWSHVNEEYRRYIATELTTRSVDMIRVPPECIDVFGFTLPQYRSAREGDRVHANEAFGEIMMTRTMDYINALVTLA